jgi:hypothetical protein
MPITVASRSKAWTIFAHSNAGIVGSNPIEGMDVWVLLFYVYVVLYVGSGLASGSSGVQKSYRLFIGLSNWEVARIQRKDCRAIGSWVGG